MSGCGPSSQAAYQFLSLEMCTFNSDAKITGTEILKLFLHLYLNFFFFTVAFNDWVFFFKYGTLHEFVCHPCAGAMLIFSVSFQF